MVDYLKYWRVIRYFIKAKYGLSQGELEMLLFLRSEKYFSKDSFDEYDELISWDKNRFEKLRKDEWIDVFRKKEGNRRVNPMFLKNVKYTDKVYRNFIKKMNKTIRQQQRLSQ